MTCALTLLLLCAMPSEDEVLSKASERILSHRTGDLLISVVDSQGTPLKGAEIIVKQKSHDFLFGCNLFALYGFNNPKHESAYEKHFKEIFNFATLPFYWSGFEPVKGKPGYEKIERMAKWCLENDITTKGHPLVWNHPTGVPRWLSSDPDEVHKLLVERVEACVKHFKGQIQIWDVVNEAVDPFRFNEKHQISNLIKKTGVKQYLLDSFHAARKGNPGAKFLINDYRLGKPYVEIIKKLHEKEAVLYDYIGIQSHMHGGAWQPKRIWDVCEDLKVFNRPLQFTEATLVSGKRVNRKGKKWGPTEVELEKRQAREGAMFYTMVFSHPAVTALTWWDFSDAKAWQGAASGFIRKDCTPKPIYTTLHKLIKGKWWTDKRVQSNQKGVARTRAFFGKYVVSVRMPGGKGATKTIDFPRPWPSPRERRAVKKVLITVKG